MSATNDTTKSPSIAAAAVDPAWSVNEVLRRYPLTGRVLNEYGVDTCCGGGDSLEDAARAANLDPAVLIRALTPAIEAGGR
jgi:iron-sulfur cluster repair protein YtfE (RIC family)